MILDDAVTHLEARPTRSDNPVGTVLQGESRDDDAVGAFDRNHARKAASGPSSAVEDARSLSVQRDAISCDGQSFRASPHNTNSVPRLGLGQDVRDLLCI